MFRADYHMHSDWSPDGHCSLRGMAESALKLGFDEIAVTDHLDFLYKDKPIPDQIDYREYKKEFDEIRDEYSGRLNLVFGAEIGVNYYSNETVKALAAAHDFDFIIASSHDIEGADLYYPEFYADKNKERAYTLYFENVLRCVENVEDYCVFGHLDYISRYGRYADPSVEYGDYSEIIDEILKATVRKGKGLEVNTSGYRYGINSPYPSLKILGRYRELGGEILAIGSDAHYPERVGHDFAAAAELIRAAGFKTLCSFEKRRAIHYDIE